MNSPCACSPLICSGPAKPSGNLRHAGEVLDVAVERVRVERVVGDMGQLGAGILFDERLPRLDDRIAVVVVVVARDAGDGRATLDDGAVDLEREHAEGRSLKLDLDLVHSRRQCRDRTDDVDALAQRKLDRLRRDIVLLEQLAIAQVDGDAGGGCQAVIDLHVDQLGDDSVAEAVFERESNALG
jgi:hypothetical protein